MKTLSNAMVILLVLLLAVPCFADFPIRTSARAETQPDVVYNSTDREYFVVWMENGGIWGKRLNEDGSKKENAFKIYDAGRKPKVAYNSQANNYLVVCIANGVRGKLVTGATPEPTDRSLALNGTCPQIVYNSIANEYLLCYYKLNASPVPAIFSRRITKKGLAHASGPYDVDIDGDSTCALAYAPITGHPAIASGKFIVVSDPGQYVMLDSNGEKMEKVIIDFGPGDNRYGPGNSTGSGGGFLDDGHVDVAYGPVSNSFAFPVFMIVWGDEDNLFPWDGSTVIAGAWCAFIDAETHSSAGDVFYCAEPLHDGSYYFIVRDGILPRADYCAASQKFVAAWKESPTVDFVNVSQAHIRAATPYSNEPDVILSRINGDERPSRPAIAAHSTSGTALVVWADRRDAATNESDIYGSFLTVSSSSGLSPCYFTGKVWQGNKFDMSNPLSNVQMELLADDNDDPNDGVTATLDNTTTDGSGAYSLTMNQQYNYYHIIEYDPASHVSTGAEAPGPGVVVDFNRVTYAGGDITFGTTYTDIDFWDKIAGTHVDDKDADVPADYGLQQNYPNPFNPSTSISFSLPLDNHVILKVYDLNGNLVKTLLNERLSAGTHLVQWQADKIPSGVYLYKMRSGSFSEMKRMILMK